jgi:hypothetical protein
MLSYPSDSQYAGNDAFVPLTFLDRQRVPVTPATIQMELDDLTNSLTMAGPSTLVSTGATSGNFIYPVFSSGSAAPWLLQIPASVMQMSYPNQGSQICKLKILFTAVDSVTANTFTDVIEYVIELVASPTVSGTL